MSIERVRQFIEKEWRRGQIRTAFRCMFSIVATNCQDLARIDRRKKCDRIKPVTNDDCFTVRFQVAVQQSSDFSQRRGSAVDLF